MWTTQGISDLYAAVNVIPDKPNYTTPKVIKPDSSDVLQATQFLASLGGPKHAHQVMNSLHPQCSAAAVMLESARHSSYADAKPGLLFAHDLKSGIWLEAQATTAT